MGGTIGEGLLRNLPPLNINLPRDDQKGWYIAKMMRLHPEIFDMFLDDTLPLMNEDQKDAFITKIRQKLGIRPPKRKQ